MTIRKSVIAMGVALVVIGGCAVGDDDLDSENDPTEVGSDALPLAKLTVPGGIEVRFAVADDGGIVVSESAPIGGVSPMSALMTAENASPLELFLALANDGIEPPLELVAAHREQAALEGIDQEPRRLSLDKTIADAKKNGTLSATAANCNLSSDGALFDLIWEWLGWNWHWYTRTNANYDSSPSTPRRTRMRSHVCNDGPRGNKIHVVVKSGCTGGGGNWSYLGGDRVLAEYRNTIEYSHATSACYFENKIDKPIVPPRGQPTYSHGLMTP